MDTEVKESISFQSVVKFLSTAVSWTIFTLLIICAIFLVYYFVATKIYATKGNGYEPKFSLYTIISPSMVPNINVYDVVIDVKVEKPEDIQVNDIITFNSNIPEVHGGTITHRVIGINKGNDGNYFYRTKGDNNLIADSAEVPFGSVVGKVKIKIPQLGRVQFFVASKAGWLIAVLIPALYIIVKDIFKLMKLKEVDENSSKFKKFLNKPLLTHRKQKLLTFTPTSDDEPSDEVMTQTVSYPKENDDEINPDDLPNLK